jgi:hypothetical protein
MRPPPGRSGQERRLDPVLLDHLAVLAPFDDDALLDADPLLRVEFLQDRQRVAGVAVIFEGDGDRAVGALFSEIDWLDVECWSLMSAA